MKKLSFILAMFCAATTFATDRFVDATFGSGNGTTMFSTITSAINAATNGDRILVATGLYSEGALTINKSLTIAPQTAGAYIRYAGNITVNGSAGMKLYFVGMNMGIYSYTMSTNSATSANRALVSFVDCKMGDLTVAADNYELLETVLTASITGAVEPIDPPGPVVPPTPPSPNNNTVVVAGGNNNFQLAGAEGTCSADTLDQCECETATNEAGVALDGIQICYEPKTRPSSAL
jgi:hypothetical protein